MLRKRVEFRAGHSSVVLLCSLKRGHIPPGAAATIKETRDPRVFAISPQNITHIQYMWRKGAKGIFNEEDNQILVQGSAKRWAPGCVNAAGKARQKW